MSGETSQTPSGRADGPRHGRYPSSRRMRYAIAAAALVTLGIALGMASATAINASAFGGDGHRGHRGPEHMMERIGRKVSWMLASVDASEEQESKVETIVRDALERLVPLREERRANRGEFMTQLLSSDVSRTRLEELRQDGLELFDQSTTIMVDALAEAADVLSAEQREELLTRHRRWRH